ncbi:MAG: glycosyltransferase family 4 protein [Salibacteraceae bacterium]
MTEDVITKSSDYAHQKARPSILVISNYRNPVNPIRPEAELFIGLAKRGFRIVVMTPASDSDYAIKLQKAGCTIIDHLPSSKFDFKTISLIKQVISQHEISIVHAFNSKAIANAAWALLWNKSVKLLSYRGYTGNIHWYDPSAYLSFLNPRIDYMICLAESVREMYIKNGVKESKAITINKGHDPAWYDGIEAGDLAEFNLEDTSMVCSFVANFRTRMKGVKHLIEAAAMLDNSYDVHFLMMGDGLDTDEVKAWITSSGQTSRFTFTGFRKDASNLVKACDVSLSLSLFGEATQKAMIEAMYLGNPVVITDISGNRGMVEDGKGGFIVPSKNPEAVAIALKKLYESSDIRQKMGEAAKKHISSFLSINRSVEEYAALYERISA